MTHQTRSNSLLIEPDEDGGYLAYFPALKGCRTWAKPMRTP